MNRFAAVSWSSSAPAFFLIGWAAALGLFVSAKTKSQFLATEAAVLASFMPTMMLSGFIFDLRSVPVWIEVVGRLLPPTYAVETFRICFLSGGQPVTLAVNALVIALWTAGLFAGALKVLGKSPLEAKHSPKGRIMTRSNRFQLLDALWASMNRIIAIAGKEFVALLKDKGSRFILVVPVIVQAVLFGYGATFNLERVPWTYYDASHSSSSMEVVRRITGTGIFELKAAPRSLGEFEETISSSTALLGLYFPPDFEKNGQGVRRRRRQKLHDGRRCHGLREQHRCPDQC